METDMLVKSLQRRKELHGLECQILVGDGDSNTKEQRENEKWHAERKDRITASNFGLVCKRRSSSKWSRVAKKLLYDQYRS
ncbi:uncharacterized protein [Halyomorpha halys]|uniref:uncharacterized protein n=1 Tax=Halyomorpha halys TaxID=286706 RepID=UPI0034D329D9